MAAGQSIAHGEGKPLPTAWAIKTTTHFPLNNKTGNASLRNSRIDSGCNSHRQRIEEEKAMVFVPAPRVPLRDWERSRQGPVPVRL